MHKTFSVTEISLTAILFVVVFSMFNYANYVNYYVSQLDSAMMVENIGSILKNGQPVSQLNVTARKAQSTVCSEQASTICAQDLREDQVETQAMLKRHAYLVLYVLAPLNNFFSAISIAAGFQALTFVGLLFAAYLFLRTQKLPSIVALVFAALVAAHPAWSLSAFGQFYPDRFFILVGTLYVWLLHNRLVRDEVSTWGLLLTGIVAAITTERAAIMIGASTLVLLVLYRGRRNWSRRDIPLVGLAVAILFYVFFYMTFVQDTSYYDSFTRQAWSFFDNIVNNEKFRLGLQKYLWVNLPYLILGLFEWRMALLAFGAMLPSMVGSIGGAEKTGWSTHYHSMYFPFVIAAGSIGYARLYTLVARGGKAIVLTIVMALVALYMAMLSPYTLTPFWEMKADNIQTNALIKAVHILADIEVGSSIRLIADANKAVAEIIPPNSSVSAPEGMMPALFGKDRVLHSYPLGIGSADYLIVNFTRNEEGALTLFGAVSFLGSANRDKLDACLRDRIGSEYQLEKTISPGAATSYGLAVFKRVARE